MSGEDGLATLRVVHKIVESGLEGKAVYL